jgi:hypothetical protein
MNEALPRARELLAARLAVVVLKVNAPPVMLDALLSVSVPPALFSAPPDIVNEAIVSVLAPTSNVPLDSSMSVASLILLVDAV